MDQKHNTIWGSSHKHYDTLYDSFRVSVQVVLIFWAIYYLETQVFASVFGDAIDTGVLGVQPRTLVGLIGIFTSPFIHGNLHHLFSNTVPFVILLSALMFFYAKIARGVIIGIYVMTGIGIWLFAREHHSIIGSSGLVYGFAAFLLFSGFFRQNTPSLAISLGIIILYSGLIQGFIPKSGVSHEAHISGAVSGLFFAFLYRKVKVFEIKTKAASDPYYEHQNGFYMMQNDSVKYVYKPEQNDAV